MSSLIDRIAEKLQLEQNYIQNIIMNSNYYYKSFNIPKKNGFFREIYQASPELKTLQYWVMKNVLVHLPVSNYSAFAYKRGDSIKRHASYHKDAYFLYHTDIKNFFPNINREHLIERLKLFTAKINDVGFWFNDTCDIISAICFKSNSLCIGTVSSPMISNIIMYDFDEYLYGYCNNLRYKYSRYADDIYISSNTYIPKDIQGIIADKLSGLGLCINDKKTWFKSKKCQRRITGLIITDNGRVSVGTEMRCRIKKMVYNRIVKGIGDPEVILGYLAFLQDVEPLVFDNYITKYAAYCNGDVIAAIKSGSIF